MLSFKNHKPFSVHAVTKICLIFVMCFLVSACDLALNHTKIDRASNSEFQDFRDGLAERLPEVDKKASTASIPALEPYISMTPDSMKAMPLVSVSVNQSVPLRDILYELAKQAEYDLQLDPSIRGSVIFTATNKPFDVVIDQLSKIAGLRYTFEDSFLRVEVDRPYLKTYKIDYLSFIRSNQGAITTNISVVSDENAGTGSNYSATSDSTADFWGELELNMTQILGGASTGALKTKRDPRITAVDRNPDVAAVAPANEDGTTPDIQPPEAVLRVDSLPVDDVEMASDDADNENGYTFSLNKQAGLINVYANEFAQKQIVKYLDEVRRSVTSQVLVEAKVFEVSLFDEHINGVEWNALSDKFQFGFFDVAANQLLGLANGTSTNIGLAGNPTATVATSNQFSGVYNSGDVQAFVKAISGFGTVRALASPRLTVLNNQSAVLNVATNRVYFDIDVDRETDDDTGDVTLTIDSEIKSVPEGVLINVQPSINLENRTISMSVRPTITKIVNQVDDPAVLFVAGSSGLTSRIPELNVQEIDTVIKVNSGQPIVMGGLLQDNVDSKQQAVPVLGEVPVLGYAFRKQADSIKKTELIIFLKSTIIENGNQTVHNTDRDLYKAFSADRRPLDL